MLTALRFTRIPDFKQVWLASLRVGSPMFKSHKCDGNQNPCFLVRYLSVFVLYGILTSDLVLNLHRSLSHGGVSSIQPVLLD